MPKFHSYWAHGLVLMAVFSLTVGCREKSESVAEPPLPEVSVVQAVDKPVVNYAYFTGRTDAVESVNVQSRVTGYLVSIDFEPDAEVKANQQLFLIDPRPYQAVLDRANGQVDLAKARLKLAIADYARALEVAKTPGAISQQDLDKYAAAENEAKAAVAAAEANSESARLNVEFTKIISPVDGIVNRNLLTLGNLVKQDETLLTTVVSQNPMYAYFDVDENTRLQLVRIIQEGNFTKKDRAEGFPVEMSLADEGNQYPHKGRIDFVSNQVDSKTGTLQFRGVFPNPSLNFKNEHLLTPGMFVRIRLPIGGPHKAIVVPQKAICSDQGNKYLKVVNEKDTVEYRPVTLGDQQADEMQVVIPIKMVQTKDGLRPADSPIDSKGNLVESIKPGDRVITSGLQRVRPGMKVKTQQTAKKVIPQKSKDKKTVPNKTE